MPINKKNINIANDTQNADLPVNELVYNVPVDFVAPAYDPDQTLLAVAVSPFQGSYIATDFKNVPSKGTMKLMTAAGSPPLSLAILQTTPKNNKMDGRVSVSITGFTSTAPNMLPLIENPQVINQNLIKVNALAMPGYINSGGTYSLLSTIEKRTNNDGIAFETLVRVWEVYGADWMSEVVVPVWPNDTALVGKKRWEVSFVGSADKAVDLGPAMLENATHASHAQTDF